MDDFASGFVPDELTMNDLDNPFVEAKHKKFDDDDSQIEQTDLKKKFSSEK